MKFRLLLLFTIFIITVMSCSAEAADSLSGMTYEKLWEIPVPSGINDVAISGDGTNVVAGGDKDLLYYDSEGNKIWEKEIGLISSVAISENGSMVVSGGPTIDIYDSVGNSLLRKNYKYFIKSVAIPGNGDLVDYATDSGDLIIYNVTDGWSRTIDVGRDLVSLAISEDGRYIAGGSTGNDLVFMNSGGETLWTRESYVERPVIDLDISSKGDFLVYAAEDSVYALFRTGSLLWEKTIPDVGGIAVNDDGSIVAVAHGDKITLFDREGNELLEITGSNEFRDVELSDDGEYLAFCSKDSFGFYSLVEENSPVGEVSGTDQSDEGTTTVSGEDKGPEDVLSGEIAVTPEQSGAPLIAVTGAVLSILILGILFGRRRGS